MIAYQCVAFEKNEVKTHLASIVEQLVLKFLDTQDLLEHFVELFFTEDELRHWTERHASLRPAMVFFALENDVVLGDPGAQHCLFAQAIDLRQATHTPLNVLLKDLTEITGWAASTLHHPCHALTL